MKHIRKLADFYRTLASVLLNTIVLFVCLNAALWVAFRVKDSFIGSQDPVLRRFEGINIEAVYPGLSRYEIEEILRETWGRPFVYEPFTQFKERPYQGRYVNVNQAGFRASKDQGEWPPDPNNYNIFMFGGSTLFGYCVADDQTIPSHLQDFLWDHGQSQVRVYNFGRGFYYSTQERILFEELLRAGFRPDMAIFVDGLNDFYFVEDQPAMTSRLVESMSAGHKPPTGSKLAELALESRLPVCRLAKDLRSRIVRVRKDKDAAPREVQASSGLDGNEDATISAIMSRYLENKRLAETVAAEYGVVTVFVWQPVPAYEYDLNCHLFSEWCLKHLSSSRHGLSGRGYAYIAKHWDKFTFGDDFLWLADMQRDRHEPLYIDIVHYTGSMCRLIAHATGVFLLENHL